MKLKKLIFALATSLVVGCSPGDLLGSLDIFDSLGSWGIPDSIELPVSIDLPTSNGGVVESNGVSQGSEIISTTPVVEFITAWPSPVATNIATYAYNNIPVAPFYQDSVASQFNANAEILTISGDAEATFVNDYKVILTNIDNGFTHLVEEADDFEYFIKASTLANFSTIVALGYADGTGFINIFLVYSDQFDTLISAWSSKIASDLASYFPDVTIPVAPYYENTVYSRDHFATYGFYWIYGYGVINFLEEYGELLITEHGFLYRGSDEDYLIYYFEKQLGEGVSLYIEIAYDPDYGTNDLFIYYDVSTPDIIVWSSSHFESFSADISDYMPEVPLFGVPYFIPNDNYLMIYMMNVPASVETLMYNNLATAGYQYDDENLIFYLEVDDVGRIEIVFTLVEGEFILEVKLVSDSEEPGDQEPFVWPSEWFEAIGVDLSLYLPTDIAFSDFVTSSAYGNTVIVSDPGCADISVQVASALLDSDFLFDSDESYYYLVVADVGTIIIMMEYDISGFNMMIMFSPASSGGVEFSWPSEWLNNFTVDISAYLPTNIPFANVQLSDYEENAIEIVDDACGDISDAVIAALDSFEYDEFMGYYLIIDEGYLIIDFAIIDNDFVMMIMVFLNSSGGDELPAGFLGTWTGVDVSDYKVEVTIYNDNSGVVIIEFDEDDSETYYILFDRIDDGGYYIFFDDDDNEFCFEFDGTTITSFDSGDLGVYVVQSFDKID